MAFDKENYYGIRMKYVYYKEFDSIHDKVIEMYEMMKTCNITRLYFKIKKN